MNGSGIVEQKDSVRAVAGLNELRLIKDYTDGKYQMPLILSSDVMPSKHLLQYRHGDIPLEVMKESMVHFFLDDWRFNYVWTHPDDAVKKLKQYEAVLSPDFSLYADYPIALQIFNTYRNRWCGAYFQSKGLAVVPTVGWSGPESFEFCFDGVQKGSPVGISTVGVMNSVDARTTWLTGLKEMINRIEPVYVICYGRVDKRFENLANFIVYPHRFGQVEKSKGKAKKAESLTGMKPLFNV